MSQSNFEDREEDTDTVPMYRFRQLVNEVEVIKERADTLSLNQVWLLAKYLGAVVLLATGVFGAALWIMVKETAEGRAETTAESTAAGIAQKTARNVSHEGIAKTLLENEEFVQLAVSRIDELLPEAVIAFHGACPTGWASYDDLGGRVIVGAGPHANRDQTGAEISSLAVGKTGGEEYHLLEPAELPAHSHTGSTSGTSGQGNTSRAAQLGGGYISSSFSIDTRSEVGSARHPIQPHDHDVVIDGSPGLEGQPHNNMPPYLALLFCIKE